MVTQDFPEEWRKIALKKLSKSKYSNDHVSVSRHAVDMYSMRFLEIWLPHAKRVGLGTFIAEEALEAWKKGRDISKDRHKDDGIEKLYMGIVYVFHHHPDLPDYIDLITVFHKGFRR